MGSAARGRRTRWRLLVPTRQHVWPPAFTPEFGNIAAYYQVGDAAAVDAAFKQAHRVVKIAVVNNRIVSNPIEPKGALARYDPSTETFTLWCPTQNTHTMQAHFAEVVFHVPKEKFRVICGDLGGGFGTRSPPYPEYAAVAYAARKCGRPVKWLADRSETFLSDTHGRDNVTEAELAHRCGPSVSRAPHQDVRQHRRLCFEFGRRGAGDVRCASADGRIQNPTAAP